MSALNVRNFRCVARSRESPSTGLLYRSATLDEADEATVRQLTETLKVKTIVDLRSFRYAKDCCSEALNAAYPICTLDQFRSEAQTDANHSGKRYHLFLPLVNSRYIMRIVRRLPLRAYLTMFTCGIRYAVKGDQTAIRDLGSMVVNPHGQAQQYVDFLRASSAEVREIFTLLADENRLPALICCQHGKDRTGCVSAVVLHELGSSVDQAADDYALTEAGLADCYDSIKLDLAETWGLDESFAHAAKQTAIDMFEKLIQECGSTEEYFQSAGISKELRDRLRQMMVPENVTNGTSNQ